jgi:hypothetical protein
MRLHVPMFSTTTEEKKRAQLKNHMHIRQDKLEIVSAPEKRVITILKHSKVLHI